MVLSEWRMDCYRQFTYSLPLNPRHAFVCGTVLYCQSIFVRCRNCTVTGTSEKIVSSPPASIRRTDQFDSSVKRFAMTDPADPAPIMIKSYSAFIVCNRIKPSGVVVKFNWDKVRVCSALNQDFTIAFTLHHPSALVLKYIGNTYLGVSDTSFRVIPFHLLVQRIWKKKQRQCK